MKVLVQGDNPQVIEKLKSMDIPELEILNETNAEQAELILDEAKQLRLLNKQDGKDASKELVNILIEEHSDDFFKLGKVPARRLSENEKRAKSNKVNKNRKKNKAARKSRKKNRR